MPDQVYECVCVTDLLLSRHEPGAPAQEEDSLTRRNPWALAIVANASCKAQGSECLHSSIPLVTAT